MKQNKDYLIRKVFPNRRAGTLLLSIPKSSNIQEGDYVFIIKIDSSQILKLNQKNISPN